MLLLLLLSHVVVVFVSCCVMLLSHVVVVVSSSRFCFSHVISHGVGSCSSLLRVSLQAVRFTLSGVLFLFSLFFWLAGLQRIGALRLLLAEQCELLILVVVSSILGWKQWSNHKVCLVSLVEKKRGSCATSYEEGAPVFPSHAHSPNSLSTLLLTALGAVARHRPVPGGLCHTPVHYGHRSTPQQ